MRITERTETMFAQAVALAQSGRMKSAIHVSGKEVIVGNQDDTIFLQFATDQHFPQPFSFFANDYESPEVELENGQIVFIIRRGSYEQRKAVPAPKVTFAEVRAVLDRYQPSEEYHIMFHKDAAGLLDDDLSHVELMPSGGSVKLVQRNIYSGARVEVADLAAQNALFSLNNVPADMKPIGLRTADFKALFTFVDSITFYPQPGKNWVGFKDPNGVINGFVSACIYDELGYIGEAEPAPKA